MGAGLLIKIDPITLDLYNGIYARVLVEVDLMKLLARRVLVTKKNKNSYNDFEFFVDVNFKTFLKYCEEISSFSWT